MPPTKSRPRAVHDLASCSTEAIRAEERQLLDAMEFLRRIDTGEDGRFDFSVSAQLHAQR